MPIIDSITLFSFFLSQTSDMWSQFWTIYLIKADSLDLCHQLRQRVGNVAPTFGTINYSSGQVSSFLNSTAPVSCTVSCTPFLVSHWSVLLMDGQVCGYTRQPW